MNFSEQIIYFKKYELETLTQFTKNLKVISKDEITIIDPFLRIKALPVEPTSFSSLKEEKLVNVVMDEPLRKFHDDFFKQKSFMEDEDRFYIHYACAVNVNAIQLAGYFNINNFNTPEEILVTALYVIRQYAVSFGRSLVQKLFEYGETELHLGVIPLPKSMIARDYEPMVVYDVFLKFFEQSEGQEMPEVRIVLLETPAHFMPGSHGIVHKTKV